MFQKGGEALHAHARKVTRKFALLLKCSIQPGNMMSWKNESMKHVEAIAC
jgi:hypothetical protein